MAINPQCRIDRPRMKSSLSWLLFQIFTDANTQVFRNQASACPCFNWFFIRFLKKEEIRSWRVHFCFNHEMTRWVRLRHLLPTFQTKGARNACVFEHKPGMEQSLQSITRWGHPRGIAQIRCKRWEGSKEMKGKMTEGKRPFQPTQLLAGKCIQPVTIYLTPETSVLALWAWVHSAGHMRVSPLHGCTFISWWTNSVDPPSDTSFR